MSKDRGKISFNNLTFILICYSEESIDCSEWSRDFGDMFELRVSLRVKIQSVSRPYYNSLLLLKNLTAAS